MKRTHKQSGQPRLTTMEEAFVKAYVRDPNAVKAARAAGYQSVLKVANQVKRRPLVAAEIDRRQKLLREKEEFDLERLFEWSVFGATYDAALILKGATFEILHPRKWPDQRMRRLIDSFRTTVAIGRDGEKKVVTEIKFAARHSHFDRIAMLLGARKKLDIKVEETRSIPMSVIDAITERWDPQGREAEATSAPEQARRLSIAEIDAINQDSDEPREAGQDS
jgi:phage terminase small subunit